MMDNLKNFVNDNLTQKELDDAIARLDSAIIGLSERLEKTNELANHTAVISSGFKKKILATVVAAGMFIFSLSLCTYAYFVSTSYSSHNVIESARPNISLSGSDESIDPGVIVIKIFPGQSVPKRIFANNNGAYPVYVRVKIDSDITLDARYSEHQNQVDTSLVSYDLDLENWTERDGYYYYNLPVDYNESTTNLFSNVIFSKEMGNIYKDSTVRVTVTLESVQANNNGSSVFDAMGWPSAEQGGAN